MRGALSAPLLARARADQVATLYRQRHRTTVSMLLGAAILGGVLRDAVAPALFAGWIAAIVVNQSWRILLARAYRRAQPTAEASPRWGWRWAAGSAIAGALWGFAALAMYPESAAYRALLIVCLFGVVLGGLNLTAVYKPSFYGFVLPALLPLILRTAAEGDQVHLFTAIVMSVVLAFILAFGHQLNNVLTRSLAMRYENIDLIQELQAQTRVALSARNAAEAATRAKSRFLAAASHDLRQPLHALGLFSAALSAKAREPEVKPLVASVHASVEALEGLFAQLLDLSRLDAGATAPEHTAFAIAPLFQRVIADFSPQAGVNGLSLAAAPSTLHVSSDPVLLERILRNFVSNALRYTRSGGVVVGARRQGTLVRIDVVDTGIGIAPVDRERIFDEFVQAAMVPASHAGGRGMGLGLSIVRRLADLLGHRLELHSMPGRGSRFSVFAPRAAPRRRRNDAAAPSFLTGECESAALAGKEIAVVDDDPSVVAAMDALFESWGARVTGGADADAVLAACSRLDGARGGVTRGFDLIVADLRLADGGSGIEAVARLRAIAGAAVPALIVTGDTGDSALAEANAARLSLLPKPVVATALRSAAAAALGARAGS